VTKFPWEPQQAYRTRAYWMILIGAIACQFPFFFFTAHWLLHLKGRRVRPADAAFAMGLFTLGAVFGRLIGGWLMDVMEGRYAFLLGFCSYFLGSFLAIRVSPEALWIAYRAAILYGTGFGWTFCLYEYSHGSLLWGCLSKGEWNDAGARRSLLLPCRLPGRDNI
jgi:MFS family permease